MRSNLIFPVTPFSHCLHNKSTIADRTKVPTSSASLDSGSESSQGIGAKQDSAVQMSSAPMADLRQLEKHLASVAVSVSRVQPTPKGEGALEAPKRISLRKF
jgi:hypothetical protein